MSGFFRGATFLAIFFLTLASFSISFASADEGPPTVKDLEDRLRALEGRFEGLKEENAGLRRQIELLKSEREVRGVPPGLTEKVTGLEERVEKVEKGLPSQVQRVPSAPPEKIGSLEDRITKVEKNLPSQIQVGYGTLKVGGLFQGWYVIDQDANDRSRIRRTELKFSGDILNNEQLKYTVMIDPVQVQEDNTRRSILQDAFFTIDHQPFLPHHKLDVGQYKLPITEEGLRSSAKLDTAERSFIGRTFGDQRDIGAMLTGDWPYATYQLGVFNGSGQNQADANDQKDFAGRIVLRPLKDLELFKNFEVGTSGYHRPVHGSTFAKKRLGYEARYEYKNFSLKGEYMFGQGTAGSNATTENATLANGWYGQVGYYFLPKLQGVLKYEGYDQNEEVSDNKVTETTVGLNYFIDKYYAKVQLNYIHKDEEAEDETNNDQLIGALQVAF